VRRKYNPAGRRKIVSLAEWKRPTALVFEDNKYSGLQIWEFLVGLGFDVIWVIKILEICDGGARCLCIEPDDGSEKVEKFVSWDAQDFNVALIVVDPMV
jgi:hypothetical protein